MKNTNSPVLICSQPDSHFSSRDPNGCPGKVVLLPALQIPNELHERQWDRKATQDVAQFQGVFNIYTKVSFMGHTRFKIK